MVSGHGMTKEDWLSREFKCEYCHKICKTKYGLQSHSRRHSNEKPFLCANCPKQFKNKDALSGHLKRHQGLYEYECSECDKKYVSSSVLVNHKRKVHTKHFNFKCDHYGNEYKTNGQLSVHVTVQPGEKPYKCREGCEKTVRIWSVRKKHEIQHRGVKEFQCPIFPKNVHANQFYANPHQKTQGKKGPYV